MQAFAEASTILMDKHFGTFLLSMALGLCAAIVQAEPAAADPCDAFPWDVSRIVSAYADSPETVRAATGGQAATPRLELERAYKVDLAPQADVSFPAAPGRPPLDDGPQAGFVEFSVPDPGRYLVAITTRHWIDVVDDGNVIDSENFSGAPGCERPHKIVEFQLPADRPLVLQLSRGAERSVTLVITPVRPQPEDAAAATR